MKMPNIWVCPLCNKNMGKFVDTLGDADMVAMLHKQAHINSAAKNLLKSIDPSDPEVQKHFDELKKALDL